MTEAPPWRDRSPWRTLRCTCRWSLGQRTSLPLPISLSLSWRAGREEETKRLRDSRKGWRRANERKRARGRWGDGGEDGPGRDEEGTGQI
eukprot:1565403-Pyramimonas_sp.AAC.1